MENKANRFWLYLLEKRKKVLVKEKVRENYNEFQRMWKDKERDFAKVFDSLRKTRIRYIFYKKWYILSKEEFEDLKNNKFEEYELIFKFLEDQKIFYYLGLSSAKYLNKLTWQSLKVIYVINSEFKLKRKVGNVEIELIKFPKDLIVNMALNKTNKGVPYSDVEKTLLDEIYYLLHKKGKLQIADYNFNELNIEKIKAYLAFYSKYKFIKKEVMNKLNKEQIKTL
ncbi:MAG: hypothetical protein WC577_04165 [Candidatus Paceibacterota bacterium]